MTTDRLAGWLLRYRAAGLFLLAFASLPAGAQPGTEAGSGGIPIGPVTVVPRVASTLTYDDNILSQASNTKSSWVATLSPTVEFQAGDSDHRYTLGYALQVGRYLDSSADNYQDHTLYAGAHLRFDPRNALDVRGTISLSHEARGTGRSEGAVANTLTQPDEPLTRSLEGHYTYGTPGAIARLELGAKTSDLRYVNNRPGTLARDHNDQDLSATLFYNLSPNTDLLLETGYSRINYPNETLGTASLDGYLRRYLAGVTWDATYNTTGRFKIGVQDREFDDPRRSGGSGLAWSLGATWKPLSYSVFDLSTSRTDNETNGNTGDFISHTEYGLTWTHEWLARLSSTLEVDYATDDYSSSPRTDDLRTYGATLNYRFRRWLSFGAGYKRLELDSSGLATSPQLDYRRNQFFISLRAAL